MEPLVTAEWLAGELGKPDLVVFDATIYLPNRGQGRAGGVRRTHISRRALLRHRRGGRPGDRPAAHGAHAGRFAATDGRAGRRQRRPAWCSTTRRAWSRRARGWWLMGLFGHDQAAVLDGGLPKWQREGRPVESGEPPRPPPPPSARTSAPPGCAASATCCENVAHARRAGAGCARRRPLHRRDAGAARGHAQRPHPGCGQPALHRAAERRRHVPPPDEVRARLRRRRRRRRRPVVTSCGSGVTACDPDTGPAAGRPAGRRGV